MTKTQIWKDPRAYYFIAALLLLAMPIMKLASLHAGFLDLGQYALITFNMGGDEGSKWIFRSHATPLLWPYALLYRLWPSPALLLLLQSASLLLGGWIFHLLWRAKGLSKPYLGTALYFLSTSLWFNALFDFHPEHLLFILFPLFFLLLEKPLSSRQKTDALLILIALCICGVKESYALSAFMLGPYLIWRYRWWQTGILICLISAGYFFISTKLLIPYFSDNVGVAGLWQSAFGYMGSSLSEIGWYILTHPFQLMLDVLTDRGKLFFIIVMFAPFAFIPVLSPRELLIAVPPLAIALLSHEAKHFAYGHQYTAGIFPILMIAFMYRLSSPSFEHLKNRALVAALACSIVVHIGLAPSPLSRLFWMPKIWNYEKTAYLTSPRDQKIAAAIKKYIPRNPDIVVSSQNTLTTTRLVNRVHSFAFPVAVFLPHRWQKRQDLNFGDLVSFFSSDSPPPKKVLQDVYADYVLIDFNRPLYIAGKPCGFVAGQCRDKQVVEKFGQLVVRLKKEFDTLFEMDDFFIFKRRH